jgi:hypothetical protein
VAELVDALDSGSSGQYACGGSSPPFRNRLAQHAGTLALTVLLVGSGCGTAGSPELAELQERTRRVGQIMDKHEADPVRALEVLTAYEVRHRDELKALDEHVKAVRSTLPSATKRILLGMWRMAGDAP